MRLRLVGAVLLSAAAYYVYLPLPSGVSEPWKLMLLDALFRGFMRAVRAGGCAGGQVHVGGSEGAVRVRTLDGPHTNRSDHVTFKQEKSVY